MKKINMNAFKVFEVATPKNAGHWMGKALTAYLNVGYYLALAEYAKDSVKDIRNENVSVKEMFIKTGVRIALFPASIATAPVKAAGYLLVHFVDETEETEETTADTIVHLDNGNRIRKTFGLEEE